MDKSLNLVVAALKCVRLGRCKEASEFLNIAASSADVEAFISYLEDFDPDQTVYDYGQNIRGPQLGKPRATTPYRADDPTFAGPQQSVDVYQGPEEISPLRPPVKPEAPVESPATQTVRIILTLEAPNDRVNALELIKKYIDRITNYELMGDHIYVDTDHDTGTAINQGLLPDAGRPTTLISSGDTQSVVDILFKSGKQMMDVLPALHRFTCHMESSTNVKQNKTQFRGTLEDCCRVKQFVLESFTDHVDLGGEDLYI